MASKSLKSSSRAAVSWNLRILPLEPRHVASSPGKTESPASVVIHPRGKEAPHPVRRGRYSGPQTRLSVSRWITNWASRNTSCHPRAGAAGNPHTQTTNTSLHFPETSGDVGNALSSSEVVDGEQTIITQLHRYRISQIAPSSVSVGTKHFRC